MAVIPFQYPFSFVNKSNLNLGFILSGQYFTGASAPYNVTQVNTVQQYQFATNVFQNVGTQPKAHVIGGSFSSKTDVYMTQGTSQAFSTDNRNSNSNNTAAKFNVVTKAASSISSAPQAKWGGFSCQSINTGFYLGGLNSSGSIASDQKMPFSTETFSIFSSSYAQDFGNNNTQTNQLGFAFYGIGSISYKEINFSLETISSGTSTVFVGNFNSSSAGFSSASNSYVISSAFATNRLEIGKFNNYTKTSVNINQIPDVVLPHKGFHNKSGGVFSGGIKTGPGAGTYLNTTRYLDFSTDSISVKGNLSVSANYGFSGQTQTFGQ